MGIAKVNITYDCFTLKRFLISSTITKCINKTLELQGVNVPCEINVFITNDAGIQAINKASRDIDKPTDVLSFPMFCFEAGILPEDWSEYLDPETGLCPLGDMAISLDRIIAQAEEFGHGFVREVGYLTIHSMLHLLGYDHLDEGPQKAQMRQREEIIAATVNGVKR